MNAHSRSPSIDDASFRELASVVYKETGIVLNENKKNLLVSRLSRRLRDLRIDDFTEYCKFLKASGGADELRQITSLLTTNVTRFFREGHHFEALTKDVFPDLIKRARAGGPVKIWSAGCSTGEEPYSIAMQVLESLPDAQKFDFQIMATDIDPNVIAKGRAGVYTLTDETQVPKTLRDRYFKRDPSGPNRFIVKDEVKRLVTFQELNLLRDWSIRGPVDVIFCRNVVIYFDAQTQAKLWSRFSSVLGPEGYLFVGHSERVADLKAANLTHSGITQYRRS